MFECYPSGLTINPDYPHLAAFPDGLLSCICCGAGLLKIKFPYTYTVPPSCIHTRWRTPKNWLLHTYGKVLLSNTHNLLHSDPGTDGYLQQESWTPERNHVKRTLCDPIVFAKHISTTFFLQQLCSRY